MSLATVVLRVDPLARAIVRRKRLAQRSFRHYPLTANSAGNWHLLTPSVKDAIMVMLRTGRVSGLELVAKLNKRRIPRSKPADVKLLGAVRISGGDGNE